MTAPPPRDALAILEDFVVCVNTKTHQPEHYVRLSLEWHLHSTVEAKRTTKAIKDR